MSEKAALLNAVRTIPDFPSPGIQFKDFSPIHADPVLLDQAVEMLTRPYQGLGITRVVGIEARGFILGPMVALQLGAGFVPVRKAGKLPGRTLKVTYGLEYGSDTIEMHVDALESVDRVLIHDDVLATGGTAAACHELVRRAGAEVAGFSFLMELTALRGRFRLPGEPALHALLAG